MGVFELPMLSTLIFLPTLGALALLLVPRHWDKEIKLITLIVVVADALLGAALWVGFRPEAGMQYMEQAPWIPQAGISYLLGVDGISLPLVLLTCFLMVIAVLASWDSIQHRLRQYMICLLLLETGMIGVFLALDLILFYFFWEAMLIPMYFLIGVWGHENRVYAAMKFILYTMLGSVVMLVAILMLYFQFPEAERSFSLLGMIGRPIPLEIQGAMFLAFGLAFAIKVPLFPFHTWLPDAHVEAPTAGSILLAGILLKMGAYGFIRFNLTLFPGAAQQYAPLMLALAIVGILYGGACALWQRDIKRLVAYSSVSHLGFVMLGIFAFDINGLRGGVIQMVNHGLSTGALFLLVGMLYNRRHTHDVEEYGGLFEQMPVFARFFLVVALSSIGLPGLNGFVGEFLVLLGSWSAGLPWHTALAVCGVILAACYLLVMYKRVFYGKVSNPKNRELHDATPLEVTMLVLLVAGIVWLGVYPKPAFDRIDHSAKHVLSIVASVEKPSGELELPRTIGEEGLE